MTSNEKLNALTVTSAFQAIIRVDGRFATLAMLVDDADLDAVVTHFNKAVTDTEAELPCKQHPKRKLWVTPEILDRSNLNFQQYLEDRKMADHIDSIPSYHIPTERKLAAVPKLQNHDDSKVMVKIILNRLQPQAEDIIAGEQAGGCSMLSRRCLHPVGA